MLGQALGYLKGMPRLERAAAFREFAAQITAATRGAWQSTESAAQNAVIFAGRMAEALVFDAAGNMFRGNLTNRAAFPFADGAKFRVVFELLEVIE